MAEINDDNYDDTSPNNDTNDDTNDASNDAVTNDDNNADSNANNDEIKDEQKDEQKLGKKDWDFRIQSRTQKKDDGSILGFVLEIFVQRGPNVWNLIETKGLTDDEPKWTQTKMDNDSEYIKDKLNKIRAAFAGAKPKYTVMDDGNLNINLNDGEIEVVVPNVK
mmetsp:Transcript_91285/g.111761  ORF Transcript_91285/g.111761 Transcript_91285/m.111761 type:complete len:164 (-) Transcript_91285:30-521(-)